MANADTMRAAIAPGSTPYGERGNLEDAIGSAASTSNAALPEAAAASAAQKPINPNDPYGSPMTALMGKGGFTSERPLTSGLSVGPGTTPSNLDGLPVDKMKRLQQVALHAKSPQLRGAAILALRRIVRSRG